MQSDEVMERPELKARDGQSPRRDIPGEPEHDHWRCVNCGASATFPRGKEPHACRECGNITWAQF